MGARLVNSRNYMARQSINGSYVYRSIYILNGFVGSHILNTIKCYNKQQEKIMNKLITEDQAQAIVNYLAKRPYAEVFNLMSMLVSLPDEKPKDKKDA